MSDKRKEIPQFNNEDEEREFWTTHDSTEYVDWSKAEKNPTFPRLKPSTRTVSIRLPESLIAELKTLANKKEVLYVKASVLRWQTPFLNKVRRKPKNILLGTTTCSVYLL